MRKIVAFLIFGLFISTSAAHAAPPQCTTVINLPNKSFIYKHSAPERVGGIGTPIKGYRIEPTLIMNKVFAKKSTTIWDKDGGIIGRCPWATAHGHRGGRYRCTMNTVKLRNKAVKNTGEPKIFFKIGKNSCAGVKDAGKCFGSSKGLCGKALKK